MNTKKLNIAGVFESIRMEKGLNKKDFSNLCGISNSFYSQIISGEKSLNLETLQKICNNLNVPIEIFIFKAIKEDEIVDNEKKRLIREIKPHINRITELLYS